MDYQLELKELGFMSFSEFHRTIAKGIKDGTIKISEPLTMGDLAVQYAVSVLYKKGEETQTLEDIHMAISHYIGNWVHTVWYRPLIPENRKEKTNGQEFSNA